MSGKSPLSTPRCRNGLHFFGRELAICDCGVQASGPVRAEAREGLLVVYDAMGAYVGCLGVETWERLLREAARAE